jgi:hypothetical protein
VTDRAPVSAANAIPPGWYGDPLNAGHARWWSGEEWTHHVQEVPAVAETVTEVRPAGSDRAGRIAAAVSGVVAVVVLTVVAVYSSRL